MDIAIVVVSARKGEFETGFTKYGQIRSILILLEALRVQHIVIAVNKMDYWEWEKTKFEEIVGTLVSFLKTLEIDRKSIHKVDTI